MRIPVPTTRTRAGLLVAALCSSIPIIFATAPVQAPPAPDFDRMGRLQAETDKTWRMASEGRMTMEKITYRSRVGDLDVPAFVFQPLNTRGDRRHPALVWVHEDIRGHLYEHYIPFIREATARGYVVIAPEYRGGIGYGQAFYDAIDYGGAEVDDVMTAVDVLKTRYRRVDPEAIGIIGWSHGGLITLLGIFRNPAMFKAAVAMVPVTNLFQRLAWKGIERQRQLMDPQNRFGGSPADKRDVYKERSPVYGVDRLADSAAGRRRDQRRGREHRRKHATGGRVACAEAAAGRGPDLREPAGRSPVRSPREPVDVAAGEFSGAARIVASDLGVFRRETRAGASVDRGGIRPPPH